MPSTWSKQTSKEQSNHERKKEKNEMTVEVHTDEEITKKL